MIELTRLNGDAFLLNALMIEQIQSYPDTTITLFNGKKIVVQTPEAEVLRRITSYHRKIGIIGSLSGEGETS
jgi:flagellar protein FlbD